jgi:predicted transcriptional regulator
MFTFLLMIGLGKIRYEHKILKVSPDAYKGLLSVIGAMTAEQGKRVQVSEAIIELCRLEITYKTNVSYSQTQTYLHRLVQAHQISQDAKTKKYHTTGSKGNKSMMSSSKDIHRILGSTPTIKGDSIADSAFLDAFNLHSNVPYKHSSKTTHPMK